MDFAAQFREWVDWTRENLPQTGKIPSISATDSDLAAPWLTSLWLANRWRQDLLTPVSDELAINPGDLATRFAALHLHYHLPFLVQVAAKEVWGLDYEEDRTGEAQDPASHDVRHFTREVKKGLPLLVRQLPAEEVPTE